MMSHDKIWPNSKPEVNKESEFCIECGEPVVIRNGRRNCENNDCEIYSYRRDRRTGTIFDVKRVCDVKA